MEIKNMWGFILLTTGVIGGLLLVYSAPTGRSNEDVQSVEKVLVKYKKNEGDQSDFSSKFDQIAADKEVLNKKKSVLLEMIKVDKKESLKYQKISRLGDRQKIRKAFNALPDSERRSILGTNYGDKDDIYTALNLNDIPTFVARFGGNDD
ncbi:hypothetical protein [Latilactobacillus sakei]|uniref:hypothetical protein n=1 Tax=Latilactobacillus sakei TaxID=1599 RepID=UPI003F52DD08